MAERELARPGYQHRGAGTVAESGPMVAGPRAGPDYSAPWLVWAPGLAIVATVLCVNFIGDGLRDALSPTRQLL